jgi:hypothetical protein
MPHKIDGKIRMLGGLALMLAAVPMLAACDHDEPTHFVTSKMEVHPHPFNDNIATSAVDANVASIWGGDSERYGGDSPVTLTVTYDPRLHDFSKRHAESEAARIAAMLRKQGMPGVKTEVFPAAGVEGGSRTMISYQSYMATPPSSCNGGTMDTIPDTGIEAIRDYRLGCTTQDYVARQVASPKDLLGRGETQDSNGRRQTNIVNTYSKGEPNTALQGLNASD